MIEYTCSECHTIFKQKSHLTQHENKKTPCQKKEKGQFYTQRSDYILDGFSLPSKKAKHITEPFAGKGDLLDWLKRKGNTLNVRAYDIDPKREDIIQQDTLLHPPDYDGTWILTNPPYLARNKTTDKSLFDKYNTNDLYKCFILSITGCVGGIFIIPSGFFFSARDIDVRCRNFLLEKYVIQKVRYFEEQVFEDTTTTIITFSFEKSSTKLTSQKIEWVSMPSGDTRVFEVKQSNGWIIGGDIYHLSVPENIHIRRYVVGQTLKEHESISSLTLSALDSGTQLGRIKLEYKKDYVYQAKESSRTYATLCIRGIEVDEETLCSLFNEFLEKKRAEYWSLFLPQFRESKEYARKRIPFELAYNIILHLIGEHFLTTS